MKFLSAIIFASLFSLQAWAFEAPFSPNDYGSYKNCIELSPLDLPVGLSPYDFCRGLRPILKPAKVTAKETDRRALIIPATNSTEDGAGADGAI